MSDPTDPKIDTKTDLGRLLRQLQQVTARLEVWCLTQDWNREAAQVDGDAFPVVQFTLECVVKVTDVKLPQLLSRTKYQEVARARALAVYVLTEDYGLASRVIGPLLRRDDSTVRYIHRSAQDWYATEESFRQQIARLRALRESQSPPAAGNSPFRVEQGCVFEKGQSNE